MKIARVFTKITHLVVLPTIFSHDVLMFAGREGFAFSDPKLSVSCFSLKFCIYPLLTVSFKEIELDLTLGCSMLFVSFSLLV